MAERTKQEIGDRVRELREEREISQQTLADAIGADKSAISRLESGQRSLAVLELTTLSDLLGVSLDEILFLDEQDEALLRAEGDGEQEEALRAADALIDGFLTIGALVR